MCRLCENTWSSRVGVPASQRVVTRSAYVAVELLAWRCTAAGMETHSIAVRDVSAGLKHLLLYTEPEGNRRDPVETRNRKRSGVRNRAGGECRLFSQAPQLGRVCDHWTAKPGRNGKVPLPEVGWMMIGSKMIYEPQRPKVGDGPGSSETEFSRNRTGSGKTEVWRIVRDGPDGPESPEFRSFGVRSSAGVGVHGYNIYTHCPERKSVQATDPTTL
ncbi:hypothetical protein C8R44DRAFT_748543 [Mycena epipterygia]|nr:hypothetical protein C8R44DRAFT_748543 [Mycena epipterygia]